MVWTLHWENCYFNRKRLLNGLKKLYLQVINLCCFCKIMVESRIFSCISLKSNPNIFLVQFGINKHLWLFERPQIALALRVRAMLLVFEKFTSAHLFQIAREKSCVYLYKLHDPKFIYRYYQYGRPKDERPSMKRAFLRANRVMCGLKIHLPLWYWLAAEMSNNFARLMRSWGYHFNARVGASFVALQWTFDVWRFYFKME